jgi:hypothetical protein
MMRNFYFTFGQSHVQKDGTPMRDYWIRVVSDSPAKAREFFVAVFSSAYMPSPDKWAFQYEEKDFTKAFFPKGEYEVIFTGPCEENKADANQIVSQLNDRP